MITIKDLNSLVSNGLKEIKSQKIFYKYVDYTNGFEKIIKEQTLKFTNPEDFNDPFDCHECLLDMDLNMDYVAQEIDEVLSQYPPEFTVGLKTKYLNLVKNRSYQEDFKNRKTAYGVSCFSKIPDETLMWSHYAEKHTGLCIGFEMNFIQSEFAFYPVNYISKIDQLEGMAPVEKIIYYWLTSKAARWSYEQEIRAFVLNEPSIRKFNKTFIREVLFGCNTKPTQISHVINEMNSMGYTDVVFKQMAVNPQTLSLDSVLINL